MGLPKHWLDRHLLIDAVKAAREHKSSLARRDKNGFNSRCRSSPIKRLEYVHNYFLYIFVLTPRVDRACRLTCAAAVWWCLPSSLPHG